MNKSEMQKRIDGLNEYMLEDSPMKFILLRIANDYKYNKAVAIVDKNTTTKDWYAIDDKYCCKTWDEIEAYVDGICKGKNTRFYHDDDER